MKKHIRFLLFSLLFLVLGVPVFAENMTILGAGATFPYPLYIKWAEAYQKQTGVNLNYQPIGSGGGIKQIESGTVDFGASDKPLSVEELDQNHLMQFPAVIGGVVPIVNIEGIQPEQLKLSGTMLSEIYLGLIKKWNDPKIIALNPHVSLPDLPITVIHRSDGSGTTYLFANYLSKVSQIWKNKVGVDTALSWPAGIGGKGNEGVASYVERIKGGIGYVEYAYAQQNQLTYTQLINQAGLAVSPSIQTFEAASINAHGWVTSQFSEILTNEPGTKSWPITGATFVLMQRTQEDTKKAKAILAFFDWAYHDGKIMASQMNYVPLSDTLVNAIRLHWKASLQDKTGQHIYQSH
jgi:phosphate transport system substrate-binding protein